MMFRLAYVLLVGAIKYTYRENILFSTSTSNYSGVEICGHGQCAKYNATAREPIMHFA